MPSPLTVALVNAVKATCVRAETFAAWIGEDEATFMAWLDGIIAPTPDGLYRIVQVLRDCPVAAAELQALETVLNKPSSEVTPHDRRMHPRPGTYMLGSLRDSFLSALNALPVREQEQRLVQMIALVSQPNDPVRRFIAEAEHTAVCGYRNGYFDENVRCDCGLVEARRLVRSPV